MKDCFLQVRFVDGSKLFLFCQLRYIRVGYFGCTYFDLRKRLHQSSRRFTPKRGERFSRSSEEWAGVRTVVKTKFVLGVVVLLQARLNPSPGSFAKAAAGDWFGSGCYKNSAPDGAADERVMEIAKNLN